MAETTTIPFTPVRDTAGGQATPKDAASVTRLETGHDGGPAKSVEPAGRLAAQMDLARKYFAGDLKWFAVSLLAIAGGILFWHVMSTNDVRFILNFDNIPEPLSVWSAFLNHLADPKFYNHIGWSLQRIAIAYGLAIAIGVPLGVAAGRSRLARSIVMPYVEIFRPIPAVAWIPLAILMWPTEEASIIYITFLGALFPIILNTMQGVAQTPEVLVRAARSLGANHLQIFRHVVLPAALPNIATGLAIGMGVAWFSLLAGEIISGQFGIGYFTWNAYHLINYPDIVVGMLCIGLLGTASTYAVQVATRPMLAWQERAR